MDWRLFLCVLLTWSLASASPASRPLDEAGSGVDDFVEALQGLPRSRQKRQTSQAGCNGSPLNLTSAGVIRSPNFPGNYPNNAVCNWRIIAPPWQTVLVTFTLFKLELGSSCQYDSLKIYSSNSSVGTLIRNLCGFIMPGMTLSSGRYMYLKFKSDGSVNRSGFQIQFNFSSSGIPGNSSRMGCNGSILRLTSAGVIRSPNFPGNYPNNAVCNWRIIAPPGLTVLVTFTSFKLELASSCKYDSLKIYSTNSSVGTMIRNLCGSTLPGMILSGGRYMYLKFKSDGSINRSGFQIQFSFSRILGNSSRMGCSGSVQTLTDAGEITSPNFPQSYPNLANCHSRIRAPADHIVSLVFLAFTLEQHRSCFYDSLKIYNSPNASGELLGNYCGSTPPVATHSSGNYMFLSFRSDSSIRKFGFRIRYSFWSTNTGQECRYNITSDSEMLSTPNYPLNYPDNTDCVWTITAQLGEVIMITTETSSSFHLEESVGCIYDFFTIYDGPSIDHRILARLCGRIRDTILGSTSNHLYIVFHSDQQNSESGIKLAIEFRASTASSKPQECGGQLLGSSGELHSPNFGISYYPNNASCTWNIEVAVGQVILLEFHALHLESSSRCRYDVVDIYDNRTASGPRFLYYCGNRVGNLPRIESTDRYLTVEFTSDSSVGRPGFNATYRSIPQPTETTCGIPDNLRLSSNIVGGREAGPNTWPWQIVLKKDGGFKCGGSILSNLWVVTAAHCVITVISADSLSIIVGEHDRTVIEGTEQVYAVAAIIKHERYHPTTHDNDIALLRLARGIQYTPAIKPICLPLSAPTSGTPCYATGWGKIRAGGRMSSVLLEVTLPIVSQATCRRSDWYGRRITSTMLCAGYAQGGRDTCQGDSGGPLVCLSNGKFLLQGITSWGSGCARPKKPGVYSRVHQLTDWIALKTDGAFQSAP